MAPYDSDSDDEENETQLSYTETEVLLGYGEPDKGEAADGNETVSRLGGRPNWLVAEQAPSAALARCGVCKALMVLLLQLNGELPDRFPGHERRLYVFACRNKGCRRKAGSIRAIRGVRMDVAAAVAEAAAAARKKKEKEEREAREAKEAKQTAPVLGEALFGVKNPFAAGGSNLGGGGSNPFGGNPFSLGGASANGSKNPFSMGSPAVAKEAAAEAKEAKETEEAKEVKDLPRTFAETLSLNNKEAAAPTAAPVIEPWPAVETWPVTYPVSWIAEAEYETLDPTPAMPEQAVQMEVDDGSGGGGSSGKEDKYVFESSMDAAFQRFADRVSQNPEQVIRYEFAGQPLLYSKDDTVAGLWQTQQQAGVGVTTMAAGPPRCTACGGRRVFEVQLMPHAIALLEADEMGLEGMDWGTVMVAVCEQDCQGRGRVADKEATYLEEWVGVQWEDLQAKRRSPTQYFYTVHTVTTSSIAPHKKLANIAIGCTHEQTPARAPDEPTLRQDDGAMAQAGQQASGTGESSTAVADPATPASFAFPHYYYFPPMFTLQPNLATRRAQMDKWTALVLAYCRHYRIFRLVLGEPPGAETKTRETSRGPVRIDTGGMDDDDDTPRSVPYYAPDLFRNRQIDRALTMAATREVLEAMRQEGRAEWVGAGENGSSPGPLAADAAATAAAAYIYWKTAEEWAALVDAWIDDTAQRGSVLTLYELTAGDATRGSELHGLDPVVLQRALAVLVKRGRAQVFGAAGSLGVKFF
ncbi:pdcd2 domain protein [Grosmannia clavigera kw1407]|uniref:ESCRT-II complex subunit VPS25 n=1 Tax=Grosmannia clavigera (strain kw1407 / UAMH 11150) TaxID=655863 RepID=F0XFY4_GROCL|nr:pdcd2 domain protein [Grosmannia clavigera kw1407]EFX03374.1 pdcd2 domain protein [Grosmannia clavigera kw1407]